MCQSNTEMVWSSILAAIPDVQAWNVNMPRLVQENGPEFKAVAQAEAKRRGYEFDRALMAYRIHWKMFALKGRNVIACGWQDGILRVAFAGKEGATFWRYRGVPEAEFEKLKKVPFPDKIFHSAIKSKGYEAIKE